jgi:multiple antibiotic resistance protein
MRAWPRGVTWPLRYYRIQPDSTAMTMQPQPRTTVKSCAMEFNHAEVIMLLLTAIGPLKVTIVCASLTANSSPEFCKRVAFRSVLISLVVCIVFAVLGEAILRLLKVSIPAFQIGGGIIVLLFSLDMVTGGKQADKERVDSPEVKNAEPSLDIAVYPLAIPLMASVSGLVAIVSLLAQRNDLEALLFLAAVIIAIMALNYVCLRSCKYIVQAVGPAALQVIGKLMGVILTALAVELILMGLIGLGLIAKPGGSSSHAASSSTAKAHEAKGFASRRNLDPAGNSTTGTVPALPIKTIGTGSSEHEASYMQSSSCGKRFCQPVPSRRLAHGLAAFHSTDRERDGCPVWPGLSIDAVELRATPGSLV